MLQFSHNSDLPYITADLPGIGGKLRVTADDFVVEEVPLYEPIDEGQHLYVRLTKSGLTTKEVEGMLRRLFGLKSGDIGFAGMKDKHARTTQTFSLSVGHQPPGFAGEAQKRIEEALPVTVEWARFHRNKLRPGHLLGNRFTITVNELSLPADEIDRRIAAIIARLKTTGAPNYFGPQRFGIDGQNVQKGMELLLGKRHVKDKWLRRFLIAAYQSHLCNQYLAVRVNEGNFERLLRGDVAKKVDTGGMFDVEDVEVEQLRYRRHEINFTAPIYGPKMRMAQAESGELEDRILAEAPVTLQHFEKARVQGTRRSGRVLTPDLSFTIDRKDDSPPSLVVAFMLPKGAFATTVMGEIMKVDLTHMPDALDE